MYLLQTFNWRQLLLGEEDWSFLLEVLYRSAIMFLVTITTLRVIGKRGIMQGVFELVVIITLGSAAGDPMFYSKVGLLPAILVFVMIIAMYKLTNFFVVHNKKIEHLIEGKHVKLIENGEILIDNFKHEDLGKDEIFSDLRLKDVSHLGQVKAAYVEASGQISVFFFADDEIRYGLPIFPELYEQKTKVIPEAKIYSCSFCGHTQSLEPANQHTCPKCKEEEWTISTNAMRVK